MADFERLRIDLADLLNRQIVTNQVLGVKLVSIMCDLDAIMVHFPALDVPHIPRQVVRYSGGIEHDHFLVLPEVSRAIGSLFALISPAQVANLHDAMGLIPLPPLRTMLNTERLLLGLVIFPGALEAEFPVPQILAESDQLGLCLRVLQIGDKTEDIVPLGHPIESQEVRHLKI